jgi:hypothetical protein
VAGAGLAAAPAVLPVGLLAAPTRAATRVVRTTAGATAAVAGGSLRLARAAAETGTRAVGTLVTGAGSLAVLFGVVETPGVSRFFGCRPLDPVSLLVVLGWAAVGTATAELAPGLIERFRSA